MQDKVYQKLINTTVRDLYWLLFYDSPLSNKYNLSPFSLFPQEILTEWKQLSKIYFLELDKNPYSIIRFVERKKNKRLGFYAEALLSYFFQTFNQIELLLQNFQIIDEKKTIGEIDFVILYKNEVIHLECAVKYFLLKDAENPNITSNWVGPRRRDNLALKLNKLIQHQLPLGMRKEVLEKINHPIDASYLLLKGVFFAEKELPSNKINQVEPNQFILQSNLATLTIKPIEILVRPNWLSSITPSVEQKVEPIQLKQPLINPLMVLFEDNKVRFVVPDNWGDQ